MKLSTHPPSEKSQRVLHALRQAVHQALEKKKRLGQHAVFWENGKPVLVGEDAPPSPPDYDSDPS